MRGCCLTKKNNDKMKLNNISLKRVLPVVFRGSEGEEPVASSEVWLREEVRFERPEAYIIEAESGTGKSSLCAYIYGARTDYDGTIEMDGRDIRTLGVDDWCELRRTQLAYLPQEMRLFGELTVMENIEVKNALTGFLTHDEIMERLRELELDGKASRKAAQLSVGQQQRVAIVRALCQPFSFLLIDEPVSHLDARNNAAVAAMIAREAARQEASVIATSVGNKISLPSFRPLNL